MKRYLRLVATAGAVSLALVGTALVGPASAGGGGGGGQPTCGGTVEASVSLTGSLSCSGRSSGITLADGVNLDCMGYSILGDPSAQGEGPGITAHSGSTIKNCTVKYFDAGVYLSTGGSDNVVTSNTLQDNITDGRGDFGDGIALDTSSNNRITSNLVRHNGAFDGIGLVGKSNNNLIQQNAVIDNNLPSRNRAGAPTVNQDDGIRIEGPGATGNRVLLNAVSGSGLEGIAVFGNQGTAFSNLRNVISGNTVIGNGFNTLTRPGNGIRLFLAGNFTQVTDNIVKDNAASGIRVDSRNNTITGNTATGNKAAGGGAQAYDLYDFHFDCDNNAWHNNTYGTAKPACVTGP